MRRYLGGATRVLGPGVVVMVLAGAAGAQTPPTLDELRSQLTELESGDAAEAAADSEIREYYEQAIRNLEAAQAEREQAARFARVVENAPERIEELERELQSPPPAREIPDGGPEEIEQALIGAQSDLAALRRRLDEVRAQTAAQQQLDLSELLADAQQELARAREAELAASREEPSESSRAREAFHASAVEAAQATIERLNQQRLSRSHRMELAELEERLLTRRIEAANARIAGLQQALSAARSQQVQETTRRTQERVEALEDPGDAVRTLASENAALADRMTGILSRIDGLAETESVLENDLQRVTRFLESVEQQLAVAGAVGSTELGMELLAQRRQLARDRRMAVQLSALDEEVTRARLESIRLGELRLSPAERAGADTPLMQDLQAERARLLRMASTNYDRYVEMLTRVRSAASRLMERTDELQRLLDSHLFWTPTTPPVSVGTLAVVGEEMAWLTAPARWADVTAAVRSSWTRVLLGGLVVVTLVGLLVGSRERMRQVLEHQAAKLGSFVQDRARYTWIALVISLALALPVPLMLAGGALVLEDGGGFSAVLASGLWTGAALLFVIEVLRHICHPEGLGRRHFGWSEYACSVLRRNLPWLAVVLVPTAMVASLVDPRSDGPLTSALSRITLAVASVAVAAFAYRVLRPGRGVLHSWESDTASGWRKANRYLLHPASVLAPLLLLGLSWAGYHYSALELESRLFASVGIVVLAVLLYDLIVRGVAVTERRLTARQTLAKRRKAWAQLSTRRAAGDAAEGVPDQLQQLEQAPEDVDAQARALVRMAVVVAAVAILWTAWSDVLPALDVLNDMVLWTVGEEGGDDLRITLGSLLAAAALAFLTYFAARNVPGSLEVAVFSRMHLQPGTGYAIKTVITYLIVLVGSIAVLNFVGAQWSKLQWLVAALGVGLGFGLQEIVANFVSGLVILFERPIRVGDTVTVGEITGTVTRIRIRATTITDWDRKEQIIPNKTFITSQLTNWTLTDPITRVVIHVRVAYGSDVGATHQALTEVIEENPRVVADPPPAVFFVGFGDSSLDFELRVFIENMLDMMPLIHELHSSIVEKLEENGIRIPYPQRDIRIRRDDPAVE